MHIDLTEENRDRLQSASNQLDMSISAIVNGLFSSMDVLTIRKEFEYVLKNRKQPIQTKKVVKILML